MFSGIITNIGIIKSVEESEQARRFCIACDYDAKDLQLGASVACNGICLTVTDLQTCDDKLCFCVDVSKETLSLTLASEWQCEDEINLELSLKIGDEIGGHFVSGHVDGLAEITSLNEIGEMWELTLKAPKDIIRLIAKKGSIAIDGISLTVNEVTHDSFTLMIIPYTLQNTGLKHKNIGDKCSIEIDMLMRYVARLKEDA